ncbi:MAG: hypothetical protein HFJ86_04025 [Oscillospiraceae bacterium]|jgi:hypothetical protein|nr:hypothetical protein [Oscillospiraceae bacterium]
MMVQIKAWLLSLCTAAVAGEILLFLSPSKRMNSLLAVVVSVFFLTAFLSPLFLFRQKGEGFFSMLRLDTAGRQQAQTLEKTVEEQYIQSVRFNLEQIVVDKLAAIDVKAEKIDFTIHIDGEKSIWINQVLLTLDEEYEAGEEEIRGQLGSLLGYQTRLILAYTSER